MVPLAQVAAAPQYCRRKRAEGTLMIVCSTVFSEENLFNCCYTRTVH